MDGSVYGAEGDTLSAELTAVCSKLASLHEDALLLFARRHETVADLDHLHVQVEPDYDLSNDVSKKVTRSNNSKAFQCWL